MSEQNQKETPSADADAERIRKRNRVVGLSLGMFVIALGIISYFRIKGLVP